MARISIYQSQRSPINQAINAALIRTDSIATLTPAPPGTMHVIRTVALGIVGLVALGAIAAAAKKLTLPQPAEVVFPVAAGDKADRLPRITRGDTLTEAEKMEIAYVAPVEDLAPRSAPQKPASPPPPRLVSRHWHDPHDRKFFEAKKQKAGSSKTEKKNVAERASKQASNARECRSDGLDPILRKLNLSPACE